MAGLREFAAFIDELPHDDERLVLLDAIHDDSGTGVFMPGEWTSRRLSQFRFHVPNESCDELLRELPDLLVRDAQAFIEDTDPEGG
ncbi:MAG: hypothetical protein GEU78_17840 [Actinobacteria bacterium]|nr:hypothetical protein [Actinomycetota bacterium]